MVNCVCLVYFVCPVYLVEPDQPDKPDKPNQPFNQWPRTVGGGGGGVAPSGIFTIGWFANST
jgi:hypothetical protein